MIKGVLTRCKRGILGALITMDNHGEAVTLKMIETNCLSLDHFEWNS